MFDAFTPFQVRKTYS